MSLRAGGAWPASVSSRKVPLGYWRSQSGSARSSNGNRRSNREIRRQPKRAKCNMNPASERSKNSRKILRSDPEAFRPAETHPPSQREDQTKGGEKSGFVANDGIGGAEGARTPDLNTASVALSQLSYGPTRATHRTIAQRLSHTRSLTGTPCLQRAIANGVYCRPHTEAL